MTAGCSTRTVPARATPTRWLIAARVGLMALAGVMRTCWLIAGRVDLMALAGVMRTCWLIAGRVDLMALAGVMRTCWLIAGRVDPMALAGVMRTCWLIAGRWGLMTSAAGTKDRQRESVHNQVASRTGLSRTAAVTRSVTGTGLIGLAGRQAGSKAAVGPWPMGYDLASSRGLASAQRLADGRPGHLGRM